MAVTAVLLPCVHFPSSKDKLLSVAKQAVTFISLLSSAG